MIDLFRRTGVAGLIAASALSLAAVAGDDPEPAAPDSGISFTVRTIEITGEITDLALIDLDGDGFRDIIISLADGADAAVWYQNQPAPGGGRMFTRRVIASSSATFNGHSVAVGRLNNSDSRPDVAVGPFSATDAPRWYETGGQQPPLFTQRNLGSGAIGFTGALAIADLDSANGNDVVALTVANLLGWYKNNGASTPTFTFQQISLAPHQTRALAVADFNQDSNPDIASADTENDTVLWFQNSGGATPTFTQRTVGAFELIGERLAAGRIDADNFPDVVVTSETGLRWFQNNANPSPGPLTFSQRLLGFNLFQPTSVALGDINGDGRNDIVIGYGTSQSVAWYENTGAMPIPDFNEHVAYSAGDGKIDSVAVADMDNDGDADIVLASSVSGELVWLENLRITGGGFAIDWFTVDGGGRRSTGSTFTLTGTIGQHDAHASTGSGGGNMFEVRGGFWRAPAGGPPPCPGDTNGDNVVNFVDLNRVLSAFGTSTGHPNFIAGADLDNDGDVDFVDLNTVLSFFGNTCI